MALAPRPAWWWLAAKLVLARMSVFDTLHAKDAAAGLLNVMHG